MDFPIENGDFPVRYVNLPEGNLWLKVLISSMAGECTIDLTELGSWESFASGTVPRSPQHGGAIKVKVTIAGKQMYNICITDVYIDIYIYTFKEP